MIVHLDTMGTPPHRKAYIWWARRYANTNCLAPESWVACSEICEIGSRLLACVVIEMQGFFLGHLANSVPIVPGLGSENAEWVLAQESGFAHRLNSPDFFDRQL